jgi:hypothetical protein
MSLNHLAADLYDRNTLRRGCKSMVSILVDHRTRYQISPHRRYHNRRRSRHSIIIIIIITTATLMIGLYLVLGIQSFCFVF